MSGDNCFEILNKIFKAKNPESIENIKFSSEHYNADELGNIIYVTPGAAAYTEIDDWNVKSIRITVEVPEGQSAVGISEIKILGKK